MTPDREPAFAALYAAHFDAVLGFALRRTQLGRRLRDELRTAVRRDLADGIGHLVLAR